MSAIRGTIQDGQVVLTTPANLPNGTPIRIVTEAEDYVGIGMREEDWPTTPEGIEALLDRIDKMEPFLSPQEQTEWDKRRAEDKAVELAQWNEHRKRIEGLFE